MTIGAATRPAVAPTIDSPQRPNRFLHLLSRLTRPYLLDSAGSNSPHARRDYFGWAPVARVVTDEQGASWVKRGDGDWLRQPDRVSPFDVLRSLTGTEITGGTYGDHPGVVGCLGYDLRLHLERFSTHAPADIPIPRADMALYDTVGMYDIARGRYEFSAIDTPWSSAPSSERLKAMHDFVKDALAQLADEEEMRGEEQEDGGGGGRILPYVTAYTPAEAVKSDRDRDSYIAQVDQVRQHIAAGDVYQVNLSHRLSSPAPRDLAGAYMRLREAGGGPYSAFFKLDGVPAAPGSGVVTIMSSSPELFLEMEAGDVLMRPIKGTRPRSLDPITDVTLREDLVSSAKDRAENVMIVDVLRNDLGRVCAPGTVHAGRLCEIESYSYVHHLVSEVSGVLDAGLDAWDLISACFPCGSVTGAPKIRAMQLIDELEGGSRGIYTGSMGWMSVDGRSCALNVAIRTITSVGDVAYMNVGGGVVWDSSPADEYEETLHKATAMRLALEE